jgi:hypothetical protein
LRIGEPEIGSAKEDGLRKLHIVDGRRDLDHRLQKARQGLERGACTRELVQDEEDRDGEEGELRHRARDGGEQDRERGGGEQVDGGTGKKQHKGALDRHFEKELDDEDGGKPWPAPRIAGRRRAPSAL